MRALFRSSHWWLWLLVLFGVGCRFYGLNWDEGAGLHPDERFCASLVPRLNWPSSVGSWFDCATSPFNPDNLKDTHYVYGQLPLILAKIVAGPEQDVGKLLPLFRALSGVFDTMSVVFTILIGRRILGAKWGVLAGAFVALAALGVQGSHFFTTDSFAATFLTLAFWSGARWLDERRGFDALLMGVFWGASLACKLSGAFFVVAFAGFIVLALMKRFSRKSNVSEADPSFQSTPTQVTRLEEGASPALKDAALSKRAGKSALLWSLLSLVAVFCTFRLLHPMAFQGAFGFFDVRPEARFLALQPDVPTQHGFLALRNWKLVGDFADQLAITRGVVDVPFNVQWIGRAPWAFSLGNLGWWGWGWALLISGTLGGALSLMRPRRTPVLFVAALFALVAFGVQGAQFSKFTRYFVPLSPIIALLAAYFWRELLAWKAKFRPVLAVALAYSLLWCASVAAIYGRRVPRLEASSWIVGHLAPGTRIANETAWDEGLPISWVATGDGGLKSELLNSFDFDTPQKRVDLKNTLNRSEWIFLSSGRSWQNIPRWPQKWPMMSRFYQGLFDGSLGFELDREFSNYPGFGPFRFRDDGLEEALSVYDHARVLVFRKRHNFSPEQVTQVLDAVTLPTPGPFQPREAPGKWDFLPQPR